MVSKPSTQTIAHAIGRYLEGCGQGRRSRIVHLGQLNGFPNATEDSGIVRQAADELEARAADASILKKVDLLQRVRDLRIAADELDEAVEEDADEKMFVKYGKEWAAARKHPISYETFRDVGVPASVLKDAGITRA